MARSRKSLKRRWLKNRVSRNRANRVPRVRVESLENRRMLAGDTAVTLGDSNHDGWFDSSDLVTVFQQGKFETGESASFDQGDWNGDGVFNSGDFVSAFQLGIYERAQTLAAEEGDGAEPVEEVPIEEGADDQEADGERMNRRGHHHHHGRGHHHRGNRGSAEGLINRLTEAIANEGLAEGVAVEDAQQLLGELTDAVEAGDREAVAGLLQQVRDALPGKPVSAEKVQSRVDRLQARVDAATEAGEETVGNLPIADVQAALNTANEQLAGDDAEAASDTLRELSEASRAIRNAARIQAAIDKAQDAVNAAREAGDTTLGALTLEEIEALLTSASEQLGAGELDAASDTLKSLRETQREARYADRIQSVIDSIQARVDAAREAEAETIGDLTLAEVETILGVAATQLADGDTAAARETLAQLKQRGEHDNGRDHKRGDRERGNRGGRGRRG